MHSAGFGAPDVEPAADRFQPLAHAAQAVAHVQRAAAVGQDVRDDGDDALAGFTDRFVLLANPMYGSWEKNL